MDSTRVMIRGGYLSEEDRRDLIELARDCEVRKALYPYLQQGNSTKDQKMGLARVLAASGDKDSVPYLDTLSRDSDTEVAQEGLRCLRILHSRGI